MAVSMYVPPFKGVTRILVILAAVGALLEAIFKSLSIDLSLGLQALGFVYHPYQLLTYPWFSYGFFDSLFNALILWFIGSELEIAWGRKKYIIVVLITLLVGGLAYLLIAAIWQTPYALKGLMGLANAWLIIYAIKFPDQIFSFMLLFPMKARYFCYLLLGVQIYLGVFTPGGVQVWGHLAATAAGVAAALGPRGIKFPRRKAHLHLVGQERPPKYWQ